jgi:hypothetical protein
MKKKSSAVAKPAGKLSSAVLALQAARQRVKAAKQQVKLIKAQLKQARAVAKAAKSARAQAELAVQQQQAKPTVKRAKPSAVVPGGKVAAAKPAPPRAARPSKVVSAKPRKRAVKGASLRPIPMSKKSAGKLAVTPVVPVPDQTPDGAPASAALDAT